MLDSSGRLTVILFAIGLAAAILGFFIKRLIKQSDDATTANTKAIESLTKEFTDFRLEMAKLLAGRHRW